MFTDLHNFTASVRGVTVQQLEPILAKESGRIWPPPVLTYLYYRWARTMDPLLYENPIWWQCIEWVNLCCLMPFSLAALYAFATGDKRIVKPTLIVEAFTFYSLIMCIGSTLYGDKQSSDPSMFVAIYIPYLIMPALVVARVWPAAEGNPFAQALPEPINAIVYWGVVLTFTVFGSYVLKWFVLCEPGMLGPLLGLVSAPALALPGGATCPSAM